MNSRSYIQIIGVVFCLVFNAATVISQNELSSKTDTTKFDNLFFDGKKVIKPVNLNLIDPNQGNSILNFKKTKLLICCVLTLNCSLASSADELDQLIEKLDSVMQARGTYEGSIEIQLSNLKNYIYSIRSYN